MGKRSSYEVRNEILLTVREKPLKLSGVQRKIGTNFNTVKSHCQDLEDSEEVKIITNPHDPATGRISFLIEITGKGLKTLENKQKRKNAFWS